MKDLEKLRNKISNIWNHTEICVSCLDDMAKSI